MISGHDISRRRHAAINLYIDLLLFEFMIRRIPPLERTLLWRLP